MTSISIIVPCLARPLQLRQLCSHLAKQSLAAGDDFELIVAWDGPPTDDRPDALPTSDISPPTSPFAITHLTPGRVGIAAAKNAACAVARGDIFLFLNDDVLPEPDFLRQHLAAHAAGHDIVLGASPWKPHADQTLLDELIAHTRMIFFYDELQAGGSYDFRHAWNLNLSVTRPRLEAITDSPTPAQKPDAAHDGPFRPAFRPCMYEDLEMAYRLVGDRRHIHYHPAARATHHHRYTLGAYLRREALLGVMAPVLWQTHPDCFRAVFRQELSDLIRAAELGLQFDERDAGRCLDTLIRLAPLRCPEPPDPRLLEALYVAHLPLKRRAFRAGLLASQREAALPWQERPDLAARAIASDSLLKKCD